MHRGAFAGVKVCGEARDAGRVARSVQARMARRIGMANGSREYCFTATVSGRTHQAREATTAAGCAGAVSAKSSARGAALRAEAPLPRLRIREGGEGVGKTCHAPNAQSVKLLGMVSFTERFL